MSGLCFDEVVILVGSSLDIDEFEDRSGEVDLLILKPSELLENDGILGILDEPFTGLLDRDRRDHHRAGGSEV